MSVPDYRDSSPSSEFAPEAVLDQLFRQLRRRHFPIGVTEYAALRQAMQIGFGWTSTEALCNLCVALWAKSRQEEETLIALFSQLIPVGWEWNTPTQGGSEAELASMSDRTPTDPAIGDQPERGPASSAATQDVRLDDQPPPVIDPGPLREQAPHDLPFMPDYLANPTLADMRSFIYVPQFPVGFREIAQIWRRLRLPVRHGPATDLDVQATIDYRSRVGIATPPVLRPRVRNSARLLLLVDRQGSMTPFHRLCEHLCTAIERGSRLASVAVFYFHDSPAAGGDDTVLAAMNHQLFPVFDDILANIEPFIDDIIYRDPSLLVPVDLGVILATSAVGAAVVILSDAGAARGNYDVLRLLDTLAFAKALGTYTSRYVWINPLPRSAWRFTTAEQIARHVPMVALDQAGLYEAVDVLRGHPVSLERPL